MIKLDQIVPFLPDLPGVRLEDRAVRRLKLHPALKNCGISANPIPSALRNSSNREPLEVSESGILLSGFDRLEHFQGTPDRVVRCLIFEYDDEQALQVIIEGAMPQDGLNEYSRILLAKHLVEEWLHGLTREIVESSCAPAIVSNLTPPLTRRRHRKEIARIAGVGEGYVANVLAILVSGSDELKDALLSNEIPIYKAYEILRSKTGQAEGLAMFRINRMQPSDVKLAVRQLRKKKTGAGGFDLIPVCKALSQFAAKNPEKVKIGTVRTKGLHVLISNDLYDSLYDFGGLFQ
jgi:hypothetical protein